MAVVLATTVDAGAALSTSAQICADVLQRETITYVKSVQRQIRSSFRANLGGRDARGAGGAACVGGVNSGRACMALQGNAECPAGQCIADGSGIAGAIRRAKRRLRSKAEQFCNLGDLVALGFPNSRCPKADSSEQLVDCVLQGAVGDVRGAVFGDAVGEILARAAASVVPDTPNAPNEVIGLTLAGSFQDGVRSVAVTLSEAGGAEALGIDGCAGGLCQTSGRGLIGSEVQAPVQIFLGVIPTCLVTRSRDAGNGTPETGSIDLVSGAQTSFAPVEITVLLGTTCPLCSLAALVCDSGPNAGRSCSDPGATDPACPPTIYGSEPKMVLPLHWSTDGSSLAVPPNAPGSGSTNPHGAFCGACSGDASIGCRNDQDCVADAACAGGFGSGCCVFYDQAGAFGDLSATTIRAEGVRGPYLPRLAAVVCAGESGDTVWDQTQGLPGPVRVVRQQLNAFGYPR